MENIDHRADLRGGRLDSGGLGLPCQPSPPRPPEAHSSRSRAFHCFLHYNYFFQLSITLLTFSERGAGLKV